MPSGVVAGGPLVAPAGPVPDACDVGGTEVSPRESRASLSRCCSFCCDCDCVWDWLCCGDWVSQFEFAYEFSDDFFSDDECKRSVESCAISEIKN